MFYKDNLIYKHNMKWSYYIIDPGKTSYYYKVLWNSKFKKKMTVFRLLLVVILATDDVKRVFSQNYFQSISLTSYNKIENMQKINGYNLIYRKEHCRVYKFKMNSRLIFIRVKLWIYIILCTVTMCCFQTIIIYYIIVAHTPLTHNFLNCRLYLYSHLL